MSYDFGSKILCAKNFLAVILLVGPSLTLAEEVPQKILTTPGAELVLTSAPCINIPKPLALVEVVPGSSMERAVLSVPLTQKDDISVSLETSSTKRNATGLCENATPRTFEISVRHQQTISDDVLGRSFKILVAALVLALLLEQAFALLFNWRLFQELFVGKGWRTPIMFATAFILSKNFNLDLVVDLVNSYDTTRHYAGGTATRVMTAAILAGGSLGMHKILTDLGFRSPYRPDAPSEPKSTTEAWLSISVIGGSLPVSVCIDKDTSNPPAVAPTLSSVLSEVALATRLRGVFMPNPRRFPRSGGYTVQVDSVYRIYLIDSIGRKIDLDGHVIAPNDMAAAYRFAPRSIIDINVDLTKTERN